jgi:hypothetical protein
MNILAIVIGCFLLTLALMFAFAPKGYEDSQGFHYGDPPEKLPPVYLEHLKDSKVEDRKWNEKVREDLRRFGGF